jgi:hypothetical protein
MRTKREACALKLETIRGPSRVRPVGDMTIGGGARRRNTVGRVHLS